MITQQHGSDVAGLLPHHLAELRASGLTDETIKAAGIYSETRAPKLAAILGWDKYPQRMGAALVFPFVDAEGRNGYARIKPANPRQEKKKLTKYESPRGQGNHVYLPPGVAAILDRADAELFITEGEKKSLSATQHGFPCLGLVGVFGWSRGGKDMRLLAELERIAWHGRKVYIAFDSDIDRNPNVLDAERRLAAHLKHRGAKVLSIRLPDGPPDADGNPTKLGLDDFLVAHGAGELHKLREAATEPDAPDAIEVMPPASTADPAREGAEFLESGKVDGLYRLRFWRNEFNLWSHGRYAAVHSSEVRAHLVENHINRRYRALTMSTTGNILDQVKAKSLLPGVIEQPAWLGDPPLDADGKPWDSAGIVVARNGMVYLPALVAGQAEYMLPATPRYFTPAALECDFRLDASEPGEWLDHCRQWFDGDGQSIEALQEAMGYTLVLDTRQQKIFMLIGPPRSGKGTVARIWQSLVGKQNVAGPTLASFGTNFGLAPLLGKSLGIVSDARLSGKADQAAIVERILSISGEDTLTIDRKHLPAVTAKLPTRLVILSNELPRLTDSSGAVAKRMILLRFARSFYGHEDHGLTDRLLGELPGILLWAIAGWDRLRRRGRFVQPGASAELIAELSDLTSPVGQFVRERCIVSPDLSVPRDDLYKEFEDWCASKGRKKYEDAAGFGKSLRAAVPSIRGEQPRMDGSRVRVHVGIAIRSDW